MGGEKSYEDLCKSIHYSDRYSDDIFEYRHVILPRAMLKSIPQSFFNDHDRSLLRILSDSEWRGLGIVQSIGWEHFETHAPEPHILLFRRERDFNAKYGAHGKGAPTAQEVEKRAAAAGQR